MFYLAWLLNSQKYDTIPGQLFVKVYSTENVT